MKIALVNPHWTFEGSLFFGCRHPHLPLELAYCQALLREDGHDTLLLDAHLEDLAPAAVKARLTAFGPDLVVLTTAPGYLAWSCPPPELDSPRRMAGDLGELDAVLAVIGPHASTTPRMTINELEAEVAIMGEPEPVLCKLAAAPLKHWTALPSLAVRVGHHVHIEGFPFAADAAALPPLHWPAELLARHRHHHNHPGPPPEGPAAEMETSRGCPWRCAFCVKETHRNRFRRRALPAVLEELDGLIAQGVRYVYFIDEMFMPWGELLTALAERPVTFGIQTRLELWDEAGLEALAAAGCVSLACGVETLAEDGRAILDMNSALDTPQISERLLAARRLIPGVRANLLGVGLDSPQQLELWRARMEQGGVTVHGPVPLFPYPGSAAYARKWGPPDDLAWERARMHFLKCNPELEVEPEAAPASLADLEAD